MTTKKASATATATEMCAHCQTPIKGDETHCSGCGNELVEGNRVPIQTAEETAVEETTEAESESKSDGKTERSGRLSDAVPHKKK